MATREQILARYPQVIPEALAESLRFAARSMRSDVVWNVDHPQMRPLGFPRLADENIHPDVVEALRERGPDVLTQAGYVHDMIDAIAEVDVESAPPFLLEAERRASGVRVRFRPALAPEPPRGED